MTTQWRWMAAVLGVASVATALFSLRYALPSWPLAPSSVAHNAFARPWLPIHAVLAAAALLTAPFQFWTTPKGGRRAWHRLAGRVYVICCLLAAPAGLILAFGATTGPVSTAGFGTLAIVWFVTTGMGWKTARDGRYADHRRWMIRSFSLTFGAVMLRLYLPIGPLLGFRFDDAYRLISFLAWVPNLVVAEVLLNTALRTPLRPAMMPKSASA
jgi:uncharacterized membrane protein